MCLKPRFLGLLSKPTCISLYILSIVLTLSSCNSRSHQFAAKHQGFKIELLSHPNHQKNKISLDVRLSEEMIKKAVNIHSSFYMDFEIHSKNKPEQECYQKTFFLRTKNYQHEFSLEIPIQNIDYTDSDFVVLAHLRTGVSSQAGFSSSPEYFSLSKEILEKGQQLKAYYTYDFQLLNKRITVMDTGIYFNFKFKVNPNIQKQESDYYYNDEGNLYFHLLNQDHEVVSAQVVLKQPHYLASIDSFEGSLYYNRLKLISGSHQLKYQLCFKKTNANDLIIDSGLIQIQQPEQLLLSYTAKDIEMFPIKTDRGFFLLRGTKLGNLLGIGQGTMDLFVQFEQKGLALSRSKTYWNKEKIRKTSDKFVFIANEDILFKCYDDDILGASLLDSVRIEKDDLGSYHFINKKGSFLLKRMDLDYKITQGDEKEMLKTLDQQKRFIFMEIPVKREEDAEILSRLKTQIEEKQ